MSSITLGLIDPFHPNVVETIRAAVPPDWTIRIAAEPTEDARAEALKDCDLCLVMATPMPKGLLERAPKLRFIQKLGAGVDRIDSKYCRENGIGLARLQAGNDIPVAEHTVLLMLAACRRLPELDRRTREGRWGKEEVRGENLQLRDKTIGIVGFGAIGKMVARLLSGFGVKIIYYDPFRASRDMEAEYGVQFCQMDELLTRSDIVTLHMPLTPETEKLIDAPRLRSMKKGAILVNAARGGLIDEDALYEALRDGHLFAAGLDAFSAEPPVDSPLLSLPNTVITPHCAGATIDNFANVAKRGVANLKRFLADESIAEQELVVAPRQRASA